MTFEEIGIYSTANSSCITCRDHSCHNTAKLKSNSAEYNVHISTDLERTAFYISATLDSNTFTNNDIERILLMKMTLLHLFVIHLNGLNAFK